MKKLALALLLIFVMSACKNTTELDDSLDEFTTCPLTRTSANGDVLSKPNLNDWIADSIIANGELYLLAPQPVMPNPTTNYFSCMFESYNLTNVRMYLQLNNENRIEYAFEIQNGMFSVGFDTDTIPDACYRLFIESDVQYFDSLEQKQKVVKLQSSGNVLVDKLGKFRKQIVIE